MKNLIEDELLTDLKKSNPAPFTMGSRALDSRALDDYQRIVSTHDVMNGRSSRRKFVLAACATGIAVTTSVGVAAATDLFKSKADETFSFPGNRIGSSAAVADGGQMLVSTTLPNGAEAQYWETPMTDNGNAGGACFTVIFSDPGVTTTVPGKRPLGSACTTATTDPFNAFGETDRWVSPQTGVAYAIPVLTAGDARAAQYRMSNGQVFDAVVQNRRMIAVIPADLFDHGYTVVALDDQGGMISEAKYESTIGLPG